jgi:hypothetical protein
MALMAQAFIFLSRHCLWSGRTTDLFWEVVGESSVMPY